MSETPVAEHEVDLVLERAKELAPKHWRRKTTLPYTRGEVRPCCIVGVLGLARWGEDWDADLNSYSQLEQDPVTSEALVRLASHTEPLSLDIWGVDSALTQVYMHNDMKLGTAQDVVEFIDKALG